jgi:hypothetical protein
MPTLSMSVRHAPEVSFTSSDGGRSESPRWNAATLSLENA